MQAPGAERACLVLLPLAGRVSGTAAAPAASTGTMRWLVQLRASSSSPRCRQHSARALPPRRRGLRGEVAAGVARERRRRVVAEPTRHDPDATCLEPAQAVAVLPQRSLILDGAPAVFDRNLRSRWDWLAVRPTRRDSTTLRVHGGPLRPRVPLDHPKTIADTRFRNRPRVIHGTALARTGAMGSPKNRRKPPSRMVCPKCGREIAQYEAMVLSRENTYQHLHCPRRVPRAKRTA